MENIERIIEITIIFAACICEFIFKLTLFPCCICWMIVAIILGLRSRNGSLFGQWFINYCRFWDFDDELFVISGKIADYICK